MEQKRLYRSVTNRRSAVYVEVLENILISILH